MLENLIGAVGAAIVEDRLARALKDAQVAAVVAPPKARRVRTRQGTWRHVISRSRTAVTAADQRGGRP